MKKQKQEGVKRSHRVAEQVRLELTMMMSRGRIRDPRAKDVVISDVKVTDDLQHARVYVRTLHEANEQKREEVVTALTKAAGFVRREIGQTLKLRYTPTIQFFWDEVVDSAMKVERLLYEIEQEGAANE